MVQYFLGVWFLRQLLCSKIFSLMDVLNQNNLFADISLELTHSFEIQSQFLQDTGLAPNVCFQNIPQIFCLPKYLKPL